MMKWIIAAVAFYGGVVALLYVAQRSLQYFPERRRTVPRAIGLPEAEEAVLDTADGERVIVWHVPPREEQPVFLCFHGNGGSLRWRDERFRSIISDGSGLTALSYRGYGGSSGRPTEKGLLADAAAAYEFAIARYPAERIVLWGESLGSAVAIAVAADNPIGREAPFTLAVDVGDSGAAFHEGPVSLGFGRRQDHCTGAGSSRRRRLCSSPYTRQTPLCPDPVAQTFREHCPRQA
jgi:uncharacterized protein